jgi:hypothetical protein
LTIGTYKTVNPHPSRSEIFQKHLAGVDFSQFAWQMKTHFQTSEGEGNELSFLFQ